MASAAQELRRIATRRCAVWITDDRMDYELDERRPYRSGQSVAAEPQCECPDFCLVQHDNDN